MLNLTLTPLSDLGLDHTPDVAALALSEAIRGMSRRPSLASWAVAAGHRDAVRLIVEEVNALGQDRATRQALARIVEVWGAGDDALVTRALRAWDRDGCERCALAVLDATSCAHCGPSAGSVQ